ncbi:MAG TPA: bifunctional DNA-formamidopyrimidine glycosylase/DNA-(apurinic or apyrimidinic site) lyase [Candidatus Obscuribacter sp.]|nr:bifunctional DNA-formamidopyrimidine glycosylase/DNA-(apurinic or apyrimidinic site) lyase [Candidatus Obscuribacter sp.]HNM49996.1 bifunctional DNA-formamidopyrimidine glycosylase/DNA-(apurinic or apyrimidinic site) lyase [Candidatus Obscuribacter sp.]
MPELPEVETVVRGLQQALPGDSLKSVQVLRPDSIAFPDPDQFRRLLPGHGFLSVRRRGKYILIDLDEDAALVCHLRMSGRLLIRARGAGANDARFLRVKMPLASGRQLHFEDMRVFGRLWYKPRGVSLEEVVPALSELGLEPLTDLTAAKLKLLFAGKKQAVKTTLLDQTLIAGVGNIYADEALFLTGVHPQTSAGDLTARSLTRLVESIQLVLSRGIESGGSTLRDYVNAEGVNGNYQNQAWVYGREDEPCLKCGREIVRVKVAGRSSHFCPGCQKRR